MNKYLWRRRDLDLFYVSWWDEESSRWVDDDEDHWHTKQVYRPRLEELSIKHEFVKVNRLRRTRALRCTDLNWGSRLKGWRCRF